MAANPKRTFRPKKLSFNETHFVVKTTQSPDAGSPRKLQQNKANIFQMPNHQAIAYSSLNSPTTFSLVLNGNTMNLNQLKSPKSMKVASFRVPTAGKTSKSPLTLNEISPSPSPSFRENTNRRVLKSHSSVPKGNHEIIMPPINPEGSSSSSFRKSLAGSTDLMSMLNIKTEEVDYLQRNVTDLQVKVNSLATARQEYENEIESVEDLEKDLNQKEQIIDIYRKLLVLFKKDNKVGIPAESPKKLRMQGMTFRIDTSLKHSPKLEAQSPNGGSFNASTHKSMHPVSSTFMERNDSRLNSKITEQESSASKEDASSVSPTYRMNTKDSSGRKDGKADFKLKVLKSIYGTEVRSAGKSGLSHILSGSQDLTSETKKLNRTYSQDPELNSIASLQDIVKKHSKKEENVIGKQLVGFMEKLDSYFSNYENQRKVIEKKNEEMMAKIERLILEKTKRAEMA